MISEIDIKDMAEQPAQHNLLTEDLQLAIEAMIESYEAGGLDGWEVQLVKRRLYEAIHGIKEKNT